jgi:hypothetical protein
MKMKANRRIRDLKRRRVGNTRTFYYTAYGVKVYVTTDPSTKCKAKLYVER